MSSFVSSLFSVDGKVAVVTGGAKGIGAMISKALVQAGAKVFVVSRSDASDALSEIDGPGSVKFLPHDLITKKGIDAAVNDIKARTGKVHILVNNAGSFSAAPIEDFDDEQWNNDMSLNVRAGFFLLKGLLPLIQVASSPGDPGRVINIGSIAALWGQSVGGAYSYGASKGALHQVTRMLASDLTRRNITVNVIAPGFFPSDMTDGFFEAVPGLKAQTIEGIPAGRLGTPEDIGGAILFLSSRAGAYVSGTILPLEGALWNA
tara:strand:+ start:1755 stop:2540 length:786 start_codon:yes stop_codon:yes gene_type:complete